MKIEDIVRRDHLAELVCHEDQMIVWVDEVKDELLDHLTPPQDYEEALDLDRAIHRAIRHVISCAFSHPEILGDFTAAPPDKGD